MSDQLLSAGAVSIATHPRYEGANIRTWIGFKHFMYLVEEAVLEYFRQQGHGVQGMFRDHGLGLEIVDCSAQLPHALEIDDDVLVTVRPSPRQRDGRGAAFTAEITTGPDDREVTALRAKLRVALVREADGPADGSSRELPEALLPYVTDTLEGVTDERDPVALRPGQSVEDALAPAGSGAFLWSWRAPYYYCHFSDRVQHSAYVRTLETVVDNFLHDRGLAIGALLRDRAWIPVVSRARVRLHAAAHMEEMVHTVFRVDDILLDTTYTATMECWVRREDELVLVASGTIMHGYAVSRGEHAGTVARLDEDTQAALLGVRS